MLEYKDDKWKALLALAPTLLLMVVFTFYPIFNTIISAFMEGYSYGVWHDTDELRSLRRSERVFTPDDAFTDADRRRLLDCWHRAVDSSRGWAAEDK